MKKILGPVYSLNFRNIILFLTRGSIFIFFKLSYSQRCFDVAQRCDNLHWNRQRWFDVVQRCKFQSCPVSTLIWRCKTSQRHINLKTTLKRRWNVCRRWVGEVSGIEVDWCFFRKSTLREKCPNTEFFLVRRQSNTDQNTLRIWTFFTQCNWEIMIHIREWGKFVIRQYITFNGICHSMKNLSNWIAFPLQFSWGR